MVEEHRNRAESHRFGGQWTQAKLRVLADYLTAYTTVLKDKPSKERPFRKAYIDAFAGTGYRTDAVEERGPARQRLMFPDLAKEEPQGLLDGSASLALKTNPHFDSYVFIEQSPQRCEQLEALKADFSHLADDIEIRRGDANHEIQDLCSKRWGGHRAVLFLDPYGMQVEWDTIKAIAATRAIDLWVLFPLGMAVNRLLTKTGDIPDSWQRRLDLFLGTKDWRRELYKVETSPTLFGDDREQVVKATMETIGRYFNNRLKEVFAGVAEPPGVLRNSANSPLYLFCFAVSNVRGKDVALRIANHLLKEMR